MLGCPGCRWSATDAVKVGRGISGGNLSKWRRRNTSHLECVYVFNMGYLLILHISPFRCTIRCTIGCTNHFSCRSCSLYGFHVVF